MVLVPTEAQVWTSNSIFTVAFAMTVTPENVVTWISTNVPVFLATTALPVKTRPDPASLSAFVALDGKVSFAMTILMSVSAIHVEIAGIVTLAMVLLIHRFRMVHSFVLVSPAGPVCFVQKMLMSARVARVVKTVSVLMDQTNTHVNVHLGSSDNIAKPMCKNAIRVHVSRSELVMNLDLGPTDVQRVPTV